MTNFDKLCKELSIKNLRMILADVEKPIRCAFCINKIENCDAKFKSDCLTNIERFLISEVEK